MEEAYFQRETVVDGDIVLHLSNPFDKDIQVDVSWGNFFDGVSKKKIMLVSGQKRLVLGHCEQIGMGYKYFSLDFWWNGQSLNRKIGLETHISRYDLPDAQSASVLERKTAALRCIAEQGVENIHTAMAMLHTEGDAPEVSVSYGKASLDQRA